MGKEKYRNLPGKVWELFGMLLGDCCLVKGLQLVAEATVLDLLAK